MKTTIPSRVWETKRVLITKLYEEEEWPLKQVIKALQSKDFHPSETQLRSRLKKWHVTKPSRKKWSSTKTPNGGATNASEKCPSPHEGDPSTSRSQEADLYTSPGNAAHNYLCPEATVPSDLASQSLQASATSETPYFPAAGSFIPPFAYTHPIAGHEISVRTVRSESSDRRLSSRSIKSPPEPDKVPGCLVYRWTACLDAADSGTPAFAIPTRTDLFMSTCTHPPSDNLSLVCPKSDTGHSMTTMTRPDVNLVRTDARAGEYLHGSQSKINTAPAALLDGPDNAEARVYGTDTYFPLGAYPAGMGQYDIYPVGYPPSKACCVQPSLWQVESNIISVINRYYAS